MQFIIEINIKPDLQAVWLNYHSEETRVKACEICSEENNKLKQRGRAAQVNYLLPFIERNKTQSVHVRHERL